jgi:hypothetical protein
MEILYDIQDGLGAGKAYCIYICMLDGTVYGITAQSAGQTQGGNNCKRMHCRSFP